MSVKAAKNFLEGFGHLACSPPSPDDGKEPNIGKQHEFLKCETKLGSTMLGTMMMLLAVDFHMCCIYRDIATSWAILERRKKIQQDTFEHGNMYFLTFVQT